MVDIDKLKEKKDGSGGGNKKSSKSSNSDSSPSTVNTADSKGGGSTSGSGEPYSMDTDEMVDASDKEVGKVAKEWANEGGDLNYDSGTGGGFSQYASKQTQEIQELHENVYEMSSNNMENFDEFTLYFHALFLNLSRNRVKVAETIQNEFGMSKRESIEKTNKICNKAGEKEMIEKLLREMTNNLADL